MFSMQSLCPIQPRRNHVSMSISDANSCCYVEPNQTTHSSPLMHSTVIQFQTDHPLVNISTKLINWLIDIDNFDGQLIIDD